MIFERLKSRDRVAAANIGDLETEHQGERAGFDEPLRRSSEY